LLPVAVQVLLEIRETLVTVVVAQVVFSPIQA
jgi:hypothetical protein